MFVFAKALGNLLKKGTYELASLAWRIVAWDADH